MASEPSPPPPDPSSELHATIAALAAMAVSPAMIAFLGDFMVLPFFGPGLCPGFSEAIAGAK